MDELFVVRSALLEKSAQFRCGVSTRRGARSGSSFGMNMSYSVGDLPEDVNENRQRFLSAVDAEPDRLVIPGQCHSDHVAMATIPGRFEATDALMTITPNVWLTITVADCTPVFLADPVRSAVAAIHAGWRGSAESIAAKTVERMKAEFGTEPQNLVAFIGPSAGVCCYEVGDDVRSRFDSSVLQVRNGKQYLDLKLDNARQLMGAGIPNGNIDISPLCTICNPELLHSYRRDKDRSGRMMGVIGIVGEG
ncbi:MAG: peptidoglycan editing factor PgeF [Bacteroidota bacterium]